MSATMEERLNELLGMAKELGSAESDLARYEHSADTHGPRTVEGSNARRWLPRTRKHVDWCSARLESAKARFLADLPKDKS